MPFFVLFSERFINKAHHTIFTMETTIKLTKDKEGNYVFTIKQNNKKEIYNFDKDLLIQIIKGE